MRKNYRTDRLNFHGPLADCRFYDSGSKKIYAVQVYIVKKFQDDFTCVSFGKGSFFFGNNGFWMVRNGVFWEEYLQKIIKYYEYERPVPLQFCLVKRVPQDLLNAFKRLSGKELIDVFKKLRRTGYLPVLPTLQISTCPKELNWRTLRKNFQEF